MDNHSKEKKVVDHMREGRKVLKKYRENGQVEKGKKGEKEIK